MSKAGAKFSEVKELLMKDAEFKEEYEKLQPKYEAVSQRIEEQDERNITQKEHAPIVDAQK